ncbi:MAG: hypothetical protein M1830_005351 [Pleopsidium flavum]|nr:MAG: hypothetical protein M1830_005351 [Pleopsidium flavum]
MQHPEVPIPGHSPRRRKHLTPIQTSFDGTPSRQLYRPRPVETVIYEKTAGPIPHVPSKNGIEHRESRIGLRSLFGRSRSTPIVEIGARSFISPEDSESPRRSQSETAVHSKTSAMHDAPPTVPRLQHKDSKAGLRSTSLKKERPSWQSTAWHPPPLFQVYPQAVKHDTLQASALSADTILRISNHKCNKNSREQMMSSTLDLALVEGDVVKTKQDDKEKRHRRRMSGSISKAEWTQKIYVLVTSGYMLQYSGEGNFDRLPERIMQLGKNSAAFASDVIPGRHWVLQISQISTEEGTIAVNSTRSVLSRMMFRNGDARRSASSFLLVLDSPEEMNAWLIAIRKEIEALGGKKYRPETGTRKTTDEAMRILRERPSRRYLIKRDPNQFTTQEVLRESPSGSSFDEPNINGWITPAVETASMKSARRPSYQPRSSTETPSISRSSISNDQIRLDRQREGSRLPHMSTETRTLMTSRGTSTANPPIKMNPTSAETLTSLSAPIPEIRPPINNRRRSMQTRPAPLETRRKSLDPYPPPSPTQLHLTCADAESTASIKSLSPSTPDFSVPSFSKRYSFGANAPTPLTPPISASNVRPTHLPSSLVDQNKFDISERPIPTIGKLPFETEESHYLSNPIVDNRIKSAAVVADASSISGTPFPRRFSSLEYSRGVSSSFPNHNIPSSPHLPPSTSLAAMPSPTLEQRSTSTPSAKLKDLRRPASMQVRSDPQPHLSTTTSASSSTLSSTPYKPSKSTLTPPTPSVHNRKSMPHIAVGPPIAPPPKCPLPATPPSPTVTTAHGKHGIEFEQHLVTAARSSTEDRRLKPRESRKTGVTIGRDTFSGVRDVCVGPAAVRVI